MSAHQRPGIGGRPALRVVKRGADPGYPKASLWLRAGARVLDTALAYGLYALGGQAGAVMALLYILLGDGLVEGQSLGKRLFGVKVIHLPTRASGRYRDSVLRNAPLGLVVILGMMPEPLGLMVAIAGAVTIGGIEAWKVRRDPQGWRLGDVWAETQVVDGKVMVGAAERGTQGAQARAAGRLMSAGRVRRSRLPWRRTQCGSR